MRAVQIILNPKAGRGVGAQVKQELVDALTAAGVAFDMVETTHHGHAQELAAALKQQGAHVVVAVGGDGTVNEVINGLAQATPAGGVIGPLAFCPIGTGNDFSAMAGAQPGVAALAQRLAAGRTRQIDVGRARLTSPSREIVRYFGNNLGLGFEAHVTLESYRIRWFGGPLRYLMAVVQALRHYNAPLIDVKWGQALGAQAEWHRETLLVSVGNSRRTGGMFYLTPDAVMDDGQLDLGLVPSVGRWGILQILPRVLKGAHRNDPRILLDRFQRLELRCASPLPVHLDGEVVMEDVIAAQVELLPSRLEIVV